MSTTNFKYSVTYQCKNQEERRELVDILYRLGYNKHVFGDIADRNYICTNYAGVSDNIGFDSKHRREYQETLCDSKELFLALASMRDSDKFFEGEYVICTKGHYDQFTLGKLYQYKNKNFVIADDKGEVNGFNWNNDFGNRFRKATKKEIINHFNSQKKEVKEEKQMDKKIIGYKLIKPEYEDVAIKLSELYQTKGRLLETLEINDWNRSIEKWEQAGVLDLWFEPVYEEKLVVGKWYVISKDSDYANHVDALVNFQGIKKDAFGFNHEGQWCNWFGNPDLWNLEGSYYSKTIIKLATESEIKDALVKEAIKRGFKEGIKHTCIKNYPDKKDKGYPFRKSLTYSIESDSLYSSAAYIYYQGKWAEILPSTPDITINGYKAEFFDTYVKFGCANFNREVFHLLVEAKKNIQATHMTNKSLNKITLGIGEFTMKQIEEIDNYFKNK